MRDLTKAKNGYRGIGNSNRGVGVMMNNINFQNGTSIWKQVEKYPVSLHLQEI